MSTAKRIKSVGEVQKTNIGKLKGEKEKEQKNRKSESKIAEKCKKDIEKIEERPNPIELLNKARQEKNRVAMTERENAFAKYSRIIQEKYEKKEPLSKIMKDMESEIKASSKLSPVSVVYYCLNRLGLKKTKVEQRILEAEKKTIAK
jgi:hypothetical protein